ncbi:NAD(P)/FAD-dependent oxidoreductase [Candidatus Bathyarchaeota archaeon]|nr:NAD(P)/FAD-dependent oxidoreductase [Candidatus Bathyarchaeota archaeon]
MVLDAVVVGAGPSGLIFAEKAASKGLDVEVLEEHAKVGIPNHCTGLLSVEGLNRLGLHPSKEMIQQKISGCYVFSPKGDCVEVRDNRVRAYAIDRSLFDQHIAENALNSGARINLGKRVDSFIISQNRVIGVQSQGLNFHSHITVDAEGPSRRLLSKSGLFKKWEKPLLGINAEIKAELEPEMAEVWFSKTYAPGFFSWVVPLESNYCRVGLASNSGMIIERLKKFIKKRFDSDFNYNFRVGQVLVDGPLSKNSFNGLLLTGDAAGHVKPTTGGGVVMGGLCAIEAADIAVKAIDQNDTSAEFLGLYDAKWRKKYYNEFRSMKLLRNIADKVNDDQINKAFTLFVKENLNDKLLKLVSSGDMDFQDAVIKKALQDPKILLLIARIIGKLALDEMLQFVNV